MSVLLLGMCRDLFFLEFVIQFHVSVTARHAQRPLPPRVCYTAFMSVDLFFPEFIIQLSCQCYC